MRFQVTHITTYTYDRPVFLDPHTFRLRPRCDPFQRLHQFSTNIHPKPRGIADVLDLDGNLASVAWFEGMTESLRVTTRFTLDTLHGNPFDFIVTEPSVLNLPSRYPDELKVSLEPYLHPGPDDATLDVFAETIRTEVNGNALDFLTSLCGRIQQTCRSIVREEGQPYLPAETLERREGACRDLAVLFIDQCRRVGLAARFVSGYQAGEQGKGPRSLHAWAEVYLPGGGWRGYDPSSGLVVADRHVVLVAGPTAPAAAALSGAFRGTGATAAMSTEIRLQTDGDTFTSP